MSSGGGDDLAEAGRSSSGRTPSAAAAGTPGTAAANTGSRAGSRRSTMTASGNGPASSYPPHMFLKRRPWLLRKLVAWKDASGKGEKRRKIQRRTVVPNHLAETQAESQGLNPEKLPAKAWPNAYAAGNQIRTTKYTALSFLPKNLFEQFHRFANLYFLFIVLLNWVPQISAFGKEVAMIPVVFVLAVTAVKDAFEDRRRYLSDRRVNNYTCRVYSGCQGRYVKRLWRDVRVGDFIHLSCNEIIPADVLLLRSSDEQGLCYIETANLDGESNLKQREVIRGFAALGKSFQPNEFKSKIECDMPNNQIYRFHGYIVHPNGEKVAVNKESLLLRDCVLKNTDFIEGIVVYAGHETKAMLNNGGPRHKRSRLEKGMNRDVVWCIIILLLLCFAGATGNGVWLSSWDALNLIPFIPSIDSLWNKPSLQGFIGFWTFLIILQVMIPLSLYVTIEIIKLGQVFHIHEDRELYDELTNKRVECRALNIPEDLGQIQYVFSDKTGTLTENNMIFRRCTIGGVDYPHSRNSSSKESHKTSSSSKGFSATRSDGTFVVNPRLQEELSQMEIQLRAHPAQSNLQIHLRQDSQRIQDFFLLLAVCNTVVVSKHPHKDQMNSSGLYLDSSVNTLSSLPSVDLAQDKYTRLQNVDTSSLSSAASTPPGSASGTAAGRSTPRPNRLPVPGFGSRTATPSPTPSPKEIRPFYEAESPDEIALVEAAFRYNCRLLRRSTEAVVLMLPGEGLIEFRVLHVLPFDSVRKRMSIILQHPFSRELILFCKGADSSILPALKITSDQEMQRIITKTQYHLNNYSRKGLRILCMAKRVLTSEEYAGWHLAHAEAEISLEDRDQKLHHSALRLERELELLGATGIEDRLQDGVPESIAALRAAGIVVWVLTGDKQETAVNIAFSCRLFTMDMEIITLNARSKEAAEDTIKFYLDQIEKDLSAETASVNSIFSSSSSFFTNYLFGKSGLSRAKSVRRYRRALVVDGRTLSFVLEKSLDKLFLQLAINCSSVLCCRSTPLQKASVVRLVKDRLNVMTLAIGDGANDVSMIQTANVGVGIGGQEGMQAVMASDFVVSRFRFLERLLLVHGHWCYDRLARIILYFFYKNACFIFVIFWYQFFCGFSGMVMMDQLYLMLFNVLFTSLPPLVIGIYDQDCPDHILIQNPSLYAQGRRAEIYTKYSFWVNMLDAFYQSVIIYFIPHMVYYDSDIGIWEYGTTIYTSCILAQLLHVSIETKSWTVLHFLAIVFSIGIFFGFAVTYNFLAIGSLTLQNPYYVIQHQMETADFWFTLVLVCVLACLPRFVIRALQNSLTPSVVTATLQDYKSSPRGGHKNVFTVAWSRDSSIIVRTNSVSEDSSNRTLQVPTISARLDSTMPEVA